MEDPESEWTIQEYPSWKEERGRDESETTMFNWILNKGYGIGKKMVITGIIVSSAPLVLPPLVVFSAMGVAFSVPFGLVFATYACTNKLMTKLLPTQESPHMLDQQKNHQQQLDDYMQFEGGLVTNMGGIVDKKGYYTDEDNDLERQNLVQREEEEEEEEERIGYIEEMGEIELADDGYGKKVEALMENVDENVVQEDQNYERNKDIVHGVLELDDDDDGDARIQGSGSIRNFGGGGVDDQEYDEDVGEYLEGDDDDSLEEERKEVMEDETEEIVKGSTGLLEKIRDEGRRNIDNDSTKEAVNVKEIDSKNKLVEEGNKSEEPIKIREVVVLAGGNEENNLNAREVEEIDLVAQQVVEDTTTTTTKRNMGSQEKNNSYAESEDAISRKEKEQFIHARETVGDKTNESAAKEDVDVMAVPSFGRPPLDSKYVKVASTTDKKVLSLEDNLDEEKMWEKIGAMRAIVGYKVPSEATYNGELKALYVFTGVEPPASFKGDSDLDEVKANLKFLMSIVGVK